MGRFDCYLKWNPSSEIYLPSRHKEWESGFHMMLLEEGVLPLMHKIVEGAGREGLAWISIWSCELIWFFLCSLRTSETSYLNEAFSFYSAIRQRSYYSQVNKEDRYVWMNALIFSRLNRVWKPQITINCRSTTGIKSVVLEEVSSNPPAMTLLYDWRNILLSGPG